MGMRIKARTRNNTVIIEDAQGTKPHPIGIHEMAKRKCMFAVKPTHLGGAAMVTVVN
jgi:hypothetical protein